MWPFKKKTEEVVLNERGAGSIIDIESPKYTTLSEKDKASWLKVARSVPQLPKVDGVMDDSTNGQFRPSVSVGSMPASVAEWYSSQGFIGFTLCAIIAQNWLVDKACLIPAQDSVRKGWDVTFNDSQEMDPEVKDFINKQDKKYGIHQELVEFANMGRVYGIRVAVFKVESDDPEYYRKPFNPDGVTPGSYKGIAQVDPIWISPQLTSSNLSDPANLNFYTPDFWNIGGKQYHHSHVAVYIPFPVPNILKPSYQYGGKSLPQLIWERAYASERTANEAPQLALTKRLNLFATNMGEAETNPQGFYSMLQRHADTRDNHGFLAYDEETENMNQLETTLTGFDEMVMNQYQLVASVAGCPATKLLGTTPTGFNSTGEYEEANYRETLESIQAGIAPLLERHNQLVMLSDVKPKFKEEWETTVNWEPLDSITEKERAEIQKIEADTAFVLANAGAIDGTDIREKITADPDSGYDGLAEIDDTLLSSSELDLPESVVPIVEEGVEPVMEEENGEA